MEARLEVRTVEERLRAISGQADSLSATAAAERVARERAAARRRQRAAQAAVARAVAIGARVAVSAAESSLATARARREAAEQLSVTSAAALKSVRARATALAGRLSQRLHSPPSYFGYYVAVRGVLPVFLVAVALPVCASTALRMATRG